MRIMIPVMLILVIIILLLCFEVPCRIVSEKYPVKGIDVSHYQGQIDWQKIKEQGISFAYIKATEGSSSVDEFFSENVDGADSAGIRTGAYHFFSFDSPGSQQAEHFMDTIGSQEGMLIPAVDVEYYGDKKKNPPKEESVRAELSAMLKILEKYYGCKPLIYSTQSFYRRYLDGYYDEYPLWIRDVYLPPTQNWVIWQYSDRIRFDGINGEEKYVDGDVCVKDIDSLLVPENKDTVTGAGKDYGVFLGYDGSLESLDNYDTIVIDAQYYGAEAIRNYKESGHTVYSYINIGSLEDFRDYYEEYSDLSIGKYEHWDGEVWVNVAAPEWRDFIINELAPSLVSKGIDGFFVDNCDVYYQYPKKDILDGLADILSGLKKQRDAVIINGGDTFLDAYCDGGGDWRDIISGINQESVFTKILWDEGGFAEASEEDREYFSSYVERYALQGVDIFLLEYTMDEDLMKEIQSYCEEHEFRFYISGSLELDFE